MTDTDWIKPGADIVVYSRGYSGDRVPRTMTVKTRAAQSFTVEGIPSRFKLDTLKTKQTSSWSSTHSWVATHPDSAKARELFDAERKAHLVYLARTATEKWERDTTRANRLAAIVALQKVEDE
jgi:hypothetical protein